MDKEDAKIDKEDAPARNEEGLHEPRRISKPDLLMAVAFWMEKSPLAERPSDFLGSSPKINKSGAVVFLPQLDRALSFDCSHGGVHSAVTALNKFGHEKTKGCHVFLSRRPCSLCSKLLIQCEVSKVFYLPIEPELDDKDDVQRVDTMFLSSNCGFSVKVPKIDESIYKDHKESPYPGQQLVPVAEHPFYKALMSTYWNEAWVKKAEESLRWHAFGGVKKQITKDIENLFKWITHTTVFDVPDNIRFQVIGKTQEGLLDYQDKQPEEDPPKSRHAPIQDGHTVNRQLDAPASDSKEWQLLALHTSRLAQMLSQRSDDPVRGVGCVLVIRSREIVAIGWNGFPAKALYGEFPRSSDTKEERGKKEPYVIHAEQNALLTRNKRSLVDKSPVLFINEAPCPQCLPMLKQVGVDTLVIPKIYANEGVNQEHFINLAIQKEFVCFGSKIDD